MSKTSSRSTSTRSQKSNGGTGRAKPMTTKAGVAFNQRRYGEGGKVK